MGREILVPGSTLDGFVIGEKVHTGGMAALWSVTRPDIDIPIVLKAPLILDGDDATAIVGFEMEQMILPQLSGVHAPRCFAVGDFSRQPYIVMEYIQGKSLLPLLDSTPLPLDRVYEIGAKTAIALDAIHRQHVIHLDVKPSNVIIRDSGDAALIDYGLSHHELLPDLLAEEFQLPMGTGPYISPEQVRGDRSDPRSDLFALGVLLYYLSTGERPFGYPRTRRGLRARMWRDPVPPRVLRPDMPEWFQEIVLRCLESDPDLRHPTAAQLAFDLRNPNEVVVSERGRRLDRDGRIVVLGRWWRTRNAPTEPAMSFVSRIAAAPIVMAAVDLGDDMTTPSEYVRETVGRILKTLPGARLACVNVLKLNRIAMNYALDEQGRNIHVQRLVELKEWARPLKLADEQATFHVLEAPDTSSALIDYAVANRVDHVVIGAHAPTALRRLLGSVASRVIAEAPCTVTVVRAPQEVEQGREGSTIDAAR
jgi:eukaryotic-like serine/threonine-protein kinase